MLCTSLFTLAAALPQGGQGSSAAPVVINEFVYDDSGADEFEFVEIYNRSSTPVDLSNWTLVGDDSNGVNFTETFPAGTILNPGDFLVVGDGPLLEPLQEMARRVVVQHHTAGSGSNSGGG